MRTYATAPMYTAMNFPTCIKLLPMNAPAMNDLAKNFTPTGFIDTAFADFGNSLNLYISPDNDNSYSKHIVVLLIQLWRPNPYRLNKSPISCSWK